MWGPRQSYIIQAQGQLSSAAQYRKIIVTYRNGYTLDNLSLMALTLSVGFVMDDAIVILENIFRHMEMGKGRLEAALDGGREIGFTIVSMTLSLAAVIMVAILISGFVSLSLTPMRCSRFLRPINVRKNAFQRLSDAVFGAMRDFYIVQPAARGIVG